MDNFTDYINNLNEKCEKLNKLSNKILLNFNENNLKISKDNLELFLNISKNLNLLNDQMDDLNILILNNKKDTDLSYDEKLKIRNDKINKIIHDKFMPFMIYTRICLENSSSV